jgi:hypothetical protein
MVAVRRRPVAFNLRSTKEPTIIYGTLYWR